MDQVEIGEMLFGEPIRKCIIGIVRVAVVYGSVRMRSLLRQSVRRI